MFDLLQPAEPDKILALIALHRDDPRPGKIDLGVGVYRDAFGATPVMRAVREAERRLLAGQTSKAYLGLAGDEAFNRAMVQLVFGERADFSRVRGSQAPGGSGALRILAELLHAARPMATVWFPDPTWANHLPLIQGAGLKTRRYPYFDKAEGVVHFEAMMQALRGAPAGDIVLLHGCCHNPTGADLSLGHWRSLAALCDERGLFPLVDLAYQGLGDGLAEDAAGLRILADGLPELAAAVSCSKNFAVYRDRVGAALILGRNAAEADIAAGQLMSAARAIYSMPPDHGAAAVRIVLSDPDLRAEWQAELTSMRERMQNLRVKLAEALRRATNSDRFGFLTQNKGMFSRLGVSPAQVEALRVEHGIYMVGDSRINVAGIPEDRVDDLASAIAQTIR
jgi:aromatic-amino-acid transaminase